MELSLTSGQPQARERQFRLPMLGTFCIVLCLAQVVADAHGSSPNIIVIITDDQGWNGTSVQIDPNVPGSKSDFYQTPSLEALAASGMRFSNAYAAPVCSPTRAAFQTGKSPARLQFTDVTSAGDFAGRYNSLYTGKPLSAPLGRSFLPTEEQTIAERINDSAAGYVTAIVGKWHLKKKGADSEGTLANEQGYELLDPASPIPSDENPKEIFALTERTNNFLEDRVNAGEPFFLNLNHFAPHTPWEARPETIEKYENLPPGARHSDPLYAAMLEDLDTGIGMVMQKIRDLGIEDNTYVIVTSDNGALANLGATEPLPLYHSKGSVYEGGVRVPMIVAGPGIEAGSVSGVPVAVQDLFATISDLAGIDTPLDEEIESASLVPIFENGGQLPAGVQSLKRAFAPGGELFFHMPHYTGTTVFGERKPASAIRDGDYKLVKLYGENGQSDQLLLFDLAANIAESDDPDSPLNLADDMPEKATELLAKLDRWLRDVDASLPYDVSANVELVWDAEKPGKHPDGWRSTTDVDHYFREQWQLNQDDQRPSSSAVAPHQPGLGGQAFQFDGNDGMTRLFFHVSDAKLPDVYDNDRSASFEFWLKLDTMSQEQLLFESGDGTAGLSISFGDSDNDGSDNDLRFRILGNDGQHLTVTSDIDRFTDPEKDFVQVTAVFNDDSAERYMEIYVNGALFSRIDGVDGPGGSLNWDSVDRAGLGRVAGDGLGGDGGAGDLPFSGNLVGQIAKFRFLNYALGGAAVQSSYNELLAPVAYGLDAIAGGVEVPLARPTNVSLGAAESSSLTIVQERNDTLDATLAVDAIVAGPGTLDVASPGINGILSAGTDFASYLLQFDPLGSDPNSTESVTGTVDFDREIIAILFDDMLLAETDAILGSIGNYGDQADRGLQLTGTDFLTISGD